MLVAPELYFHSGKKILNIATLSLSKKCLLHLNFASTVAAHQELSVCVGAHACVAHLRTKVDFICICIIFLYYIGILV